MTAQAQHIAPQIPPGTRVYAIGDVHGRLDLLDELLERIERDARTPAADGAVPPRKVLIFLGDLIDRGAQSRGVLDRVAELRAGRRLAGFEVHALKGNHEDALLNFLSGYDDGEVWRDNGGDKALQSFAIDPGQPPGELRRALLNALSDDHRRLLRDLTLSHIEGDYAFVHAGVRPGVAWDRQTPQDLMWIRKEFTMSTADFGYVVVHGHCPTPEPDVRPNRIGIDTRAWASGHLTCLVIDGDAQRFLAT